MVRATANAVEGSLKRQNRASSPKAFARTLYTREFHDGRQGTSSCKGSVIACAPATLRMTDCFLPTTGD